MVLLISGAAAWAQMNAGEVGGSVKDQLGGLLPGAIVIAEQAGTGLKFTAVSNSAGEYLFAQVPGGTYSFKVTAPNFKQSALAQLEVHVGEKLRRDFTLQVGDSS